MFTFPMSFWILRSTAEPFSTATGVVVTISHQQPEDFAWRSIMFTVGVSFLSVSDLFLQMFSQQTASFPLIPNYSWDEELLFVKHGLPRPVGLLLHRVLQKVKVSHLEWIHLIIIATSYIQLRLYQPGGDLRPCTGQPMQSPWSSASDGRKTYLLGYSCHQSEQKHTTDFLLMGSGSGCASRQVKWKGNKIVLTFPECIFKMIRLERVQRKNFNIFFSIQYS